MAKKDIIEENIPSKVVKITKDLSCDLNEVEWQNKARELADANRHVEYLEDRKKSTVADFNSDIKSAKLALQKLTNAVANRRETREVTVELTYDYDKGFLIETRTDTNEELNRRELSTMERQGELEFHDPNEVIESRHKDI